MGPGRRNASAVFDIALFSPLVIAARTQAMILGSLFPAKRSRREVMRMLREKPLAGAESMVAAQNALVARGADFWADAALANARFWFDLAGEIGPAMLAPVSRRVRGNARRLTRR